MINLKHYENLQLDDPIRFYPISCPIIEYEPLRSCFTILESPEDIRKGIVSLISFREGDLVANLTGFILPFQNLHTLQKAEGEFLSDEFFSGYLLHSCEPNAELRFDPYSIHAIKPIKAFDSILIDYEKTENVLAQSFTCKCGAPSCRGWIAGKKAHN
jgi:hypothetical protein